MIMSLWSGAAPVVPESAPSDLVTYLQRGGSFRLPAEGWALVISALLFLAAGVILLIPVLKERKEGKK